MQHRHVRLSWPGPAAIALWMCGLASGAAPVIAVAAAPALGVTVPVGATLAVAPAPAVAPPPTPAVAPPPGGGMAMMGSSTDSTLDLAWLEHAVLAGNPTLAAARAAWREARASADRVGAWDQPMVEAMIAPSSVGRDELETGYRIGVEQRLAIFGQRGLKRRAAESDGWAMGHDYHAARLELLREARVAYADYYYVARAQETNAEVSGLIRAAHEAALAQYAAGTAPQSDPLQADAELAMLEHERVALALQRRRVAARLQALLHWPPDRVLPAPPWALELPPELAAPADSMPWPDLKAADARIAASQAMLDESKRMRLPETAFAFEYDRTMMVPEYRAMVGLVMDLPIEFGRLGAGEREESAALARATAEREALRDRIALDITLASDELREARHEIEVVTGWLLPAREHAQKAVHAAYATNRAEFMSLITATRDLARARLDFHAALATACRADAALRRALATDAIPLEQEDRR